MSGNTMKNQLTGLMTEQTQATVSPEPTTFMTHVVIPLLQNLVGGLAVGVLCSVVAIGLGRYFLWQIILDELKIWSLLAGLLVTSLATVVRFFGDDLGIVLAAYRLGRRSADRQISALVAEVEQLRAAARELRASQPSHRAQDMLERIEKAQSDAEQLLGLAYAGQSISREKVSAFISQRPWERAINLMRAAGCLDGSGNLTEPNLGVALKRLRGHVERDRERAAGGNWLPKWIAETKR